MYETTLGTRVLRGAEARLVASVAWSLTDHLRKMVPSSQGQTCSDLIDIPTLHALTMEQVIVLIDRVTMFLLDPAVRAPKRTAILDATIAALYQQIADDVQSEIDVAADLEAYEDDDDDTLIRTMLVAASEQTSDPESSPLHTPHPECAVMESWELVIERLRDRVLPDTDWLLEADMLDLQPGESAKMKKCMGIDNDYFIDVMADASVDDAVSAWCDMMQRISGRRSEKWRFGGGLPVPEDADLPPRIEILSFTENYPDNLELF